jgi:hypothetical protein
MSANQRIISGAINTGNNTPTGAKMKIAVDNPYITKDDFIRSFEAQGLGITQNSPQYQNGVLDELLLECSAAVNRYCGRWFDTQTIDEQKTSFTVKPYNPQLVTVILKNRPYSKINSAYIQVLEWFIQIIVSGPDSYLQDFYDGGFYKIVPLLSTAGTGVGSPIPAAILDHVPLGILWTNYTFGYGTVLTAETLTVIAETKQYQADLGRRLMAPDQVINIYDSGILVSPSNYTIDYANAMVTFISAYTPNGAITADYTSNESVPFDIKKAVILYAAHLAGQALQNPLGAASLGIQTYTINFGNNSKVEERFKKLLEPYVDIMSTVAFLGL